MAVLIPDMQMPKSCGECRFLCGEDDLCYAVENGMTPANNGRSDWCPLVEIPKRSVDDKLLEESGFEL